MSTVEMKRISLREICTSMFIAALFMITKIIRQPKHLFDEWLDKKMLYVNIGNGILFSHKKEVNPTIGYNMDKSGVHYTKLDTPDKVKYV